jgi:hypothetical protein
MTQLTILELDAADVQRAWPLARMAAPSLWLGGWEQSARDLIERHGKVLAVAAPDGCFHGIATAEVMEKPRGARVLYVETLVTLELSRRAPVRSFLCDSLERLAAKLGCNGVAVAAPSDSRVPRSWRSPDWLAATRPKDLWSEG